MAQEMLGGGKAMWKGSVDHKVIEGYPDPVISSKLLGLTAHPEDGGVDKARELARVFISGNYSGTHGGGIMCNGFLMMGELKRAFYNISLAVDFTKSYLDKDGNPAALENGKFQFELYEEETKPDGAKEQKLLGVYSNTAAAADSGEPNVRMILPYDFQGTETLGDGGEPDLTGIAGTHVYYLKEQVPSQDAAVIYDPTVYKLEVEVGHGKKDLVLTSEKKFRIDWLYVNSVRVSLVDPDGKELGEAQTDQEYIGDYEGVTNSHGPHLTIWGSQKEGDPGEKNPAFTNQAETPLLTFTLWKKDQFKVDQGETGTMDLVRFSLWEMEDGRIKTETDTDGVSKPAGPGEKLTEEGVIQYTVPDMEKTYLLQETVPNGYEAAGPWIVTTDGKEGITLWTARETEEGKYEQAEQMEEEKGNSFCFTIFNNPIQYSLPETGGTGRNLYGPTGILLILLAAAAAGTYGLRRKKQERRSK